MRISIITPSFNQAQYLEQTIDSVLSQGYPNLEYIIIDGGSSDGSIEIIKKYRKHLSYWESQPDEGQSHAINKGIGRANGEIINWLNSDDYLESWSLDYIAECFKDPQVKVLCARARHFNDEGQVKESNGTDVYADNLEKTIGWARFDQPETYFRKEAWDRVGPLNSNLHYLMDREWWIRYLLLFGLEGITNSEKVLVNFRLHDDSKTVSKTEKFQWDHDAIFYEMALTYRFEKVATLIKSNCQINSDYTFPKQTPTDLTCIENVLNYYLLHRAHEFYYQGNYLSAKTFLKKVHPDQLDVDAKQLCRRLKLRNTYLPKSLINVSRRR